MTTKPGHGRALHLTLILLLGTVLAACGGGGGGGGSPPAPPVSIVATPGSVTFTASVATVIASQINVDIALNNLPASAQYFEGGYSDAGIADINFAASSTKAALLTIWFKAPFSLAPGTYTDSVQLRACEDAQCLKPVAGATVTIPVTYTVKTPTGADALSFSLATHAVQRTVLYTDAPSRPQIPIAATLNGLEVFPYTNVAITGTGIESVDFSPSGLKAGTVYVNLVNPGSLARGTYHAVAALTVCLDSNCVNPVPGSPFQITVDYTVTDALSVTGPNGYSIRVLESQFSDVVWDASRQLLYAAVPAKNGGFTGTVASFDPVTGAIVNEVAVAGQPDRIALSDDAQFVYVTLSDHSAIQRFALPALSADLSINLGTNAAGHALLPIDVQVMPGFPHTIAVSLSDPIGAEAHAGVAIYDDAVKRPATADVIASPLSGALVDQLQWGGNATTLFGANVASNKSLYTMSVDASGVHLTSETANAGGGAITFDGGLLYGDSGNIVDPATSSVVRVFNPLGPLMVLLPDSGHHKLFVHGLGSTSGTPELQSFDLTTYAPIASVPIPILSLATRRMVRWGSDGIAMVGPYYFVLINGPFVGP